MESNIDRTRLIRQLMTVAGMSYREAAEEADRLYWEQMLEGELFHDDV